MFATQILRNPNLKAIFSRARRTKALLILFPELRDIVLQRGFANSTKGNEEVKKTQEQPENTKPENKETASSITAEEAAEPEVELKQGGRKIHVDAKPESLSSAKAAIDTGRLLFRIGTWAGMALFGYNLYLVSSKKDPENEIGAIPILMRPAKLLSDYFQSMIDFFTKPPMDKLLPDHPELPPGFPIPKTLVLSLSGVLTHTEYKLGKGPEISKRPGLVDFLRHLSQFYEIVLFADEDTFHIQSVADRFDPARQLVPMRLGRESAVMKKGRLIKDLSYLNRDLRRIIIIEKNPDHLTDEHKHNSIFVPEFKGEVDDKTLYELAPFLEHLARPEIKDVRKELDKYDHVDCGRKFLEELKKIKDEYNRRRGGLSKVMTKGQRGSAN